MAPLALNTAPADVIVVPTGGACATPSSGWHAMGWRRWP
ncbi:hypothetical protein ACUXS8_004110 [Burkholderia sp. 140710050-1(v2)]|jgi:hypothetical protein